jgi:hypothetical protein
MPMASLPARIELQRTRELFEGHRENRRSASVLTVTGSEPGLNTRELASRDGVNDEGQMSRFPSGHTATTKENT